MKKISIILTTATVITSMQVSAQWSAVRFDSSNTFMKVFAATANDVFVIGAEPTAYDNFFLRSSDGGTTWDSIGLSIGNDDFQMSEISFPDVSNGYIGGRKNNVYQNLQKTTDNGTTWSDVTPDPTQVEPISALHFIDAMQGWATCGNTLYTTNNGGATWSSAPLSFTPQDLYFMNATIGYACGGISSSPAIVMKTTDGGVTWTQVLENYDPNLFVSTNVYLNIVDANTIFTCQEWTNKLYRTTNAGATWDTIVCDSAMQIVDFHFESTDSGHVLTSMGQLFYTNDAGATWNLAYSAEWGLYGPSVYFYSLCFSQGTGYVCGSSGLIKRFDYNPNGIINHVNETGSLKIYPNPCYGMQNITVESTGMNGDCSLWIINSLGEVVHYEVIGSIETKQVVSLRGLQLASGTYTVVLHGDVNRQSSRLVITD